MGNNHVNELKTVKGQVTGTKISIAGFQIYLVLGDFCIYGCACLKQADELGVNIIKLFGVNFNLLQNFNWNFKSTF